MLIVTIVLAIALIVETIFLLKKNSKNDDLYKSIDSFSKGQLDRADDLPELIPGDHHYLKLKKAVSNIALFFKNINNSTIETEKASSRLSTQVQKILLTSSNIILNTKNNLQNTKILSDNIMEGSAAVEEIQASIESVSNQLEYQNSKINEDFISIRNMTKSIESISQTSKSRINDTKELVNLSSAGYSKITETNEFIKTVKLSVEDVLTLNTVINSIAAKTNLLSMNAAIEAAHAGEAGKGFAVVAEEIRKLASLTANNAKDISSTLKELDSNITKAANISRDSGETFKKIDNGVNKVATAFNQISDQTQMLLDTANNVTGNISDLVSISDQTKDSMNEMEIGVRDVTETFEHTKEFSSNLRDSMGELFDESKNMNLSSSKLSKSFLDINKVLIKLITNVSQYNSKGNKDSDLADKIKIRNLIISHINWVATARAVIDGSVEISEDLLVSKDKCSLGIWLKNSDTNMLSADQLRVLNFNHDNLHDTVAKIINNIQNNNLFEAENLFIELTDYSRNIVEVLTTISTDTFISFTPELSVGVDEFDKHHQVLFDIINKLSRSMNSGAGQFKIKQILKELVDYTDWHFAAEEKAFEEYNYQNKDSHKKIHDSMLKTARDLLSDAESGKKLLSTEVLEFLQDWILNHIMGIDKEYSSYFKDKVIKV